ncbi:LCP family protein [Heyndrickxia sporothermodurans]
MPNKKKKRSKKKIIGFSLLTILVLIIGFSAYAYYELQPKRHFQSVPIINTDEVKQKEANDSDQTVEPKEPIFNVLLIGSDERKGEKIGHSDSMMIVNVNLKKNEYHVISIPRDSRVYLENYGYTKLTSVQYVSQAAKGAKEGIEDAVKAVGHFTGIPINYYVETNYWGFLAMVDALGGIEMNVPFDVKLTHPWDKKYKNKIIKAGKQSLDGKMVTEIVHERYSLKTGEYGRQQLQQEALIGIARESLKPSNLTKLPSLVNSVSEFLLATNMSNTDIISLGLAVKDFDPATQVHYHQLKGEGKTMYDDVLKSNNSQIIIDENNMKEIVEKYFLGS